MNQSKVTSRYSKSLLQLSIEKNCLEKSYVDMVLFMQTCLESKELRLLLRNPIIKSEKKRTILNKIFKNKVGSISMDFIDVIVRNKRESLLSLIASNFISQYKKYKNIEEVIVTTAIPLEEKLKKRIVEYIKKDRNIDVELTEIIDEKIIGGTIIRMGDKQLDASVSSEISELRQVFNKNLRLQES